MQILSKEKKIVRSYRTIIEKHSELKVPIKCFISKLLGKKQSLLKIEGVPKPESCDVCVCMCVYVRESVCVCVLGCTVKVIFKAVANITRSDITDSSKKDSVLKIGNEKNTSA